MPTVEERVSVLEMQVSDIRGDTTQIFRKLDELVVTLSQRPSWTITFALTFLSSLCVGLAVALATRVG